MLKGRFVNNRIHKFETPWVIIIFCVISLHSNNQLLV